jgi:hypothetical protein
MYRLVASVPAHEGPVYPFPAPVAPLIPSPDQSTLELGLQDSHHRRTGRIDELILPTSMTFVPIGFCSQGMDN